MRTTTTTSIQKSRNERGAALIFALSMLAIFGFMGVAYVKYMSLNLVESDLDLRKARARQLAVSGIQIAASGLRQEVLSANHKVPRNTPAAFDLATYNGITHGDEGIVAEPMNVTRLARTTVTVYDEGGRVNLNHAPASALQKLLGVDGDTARNITANVPRGAQGPDARWFLTTDELLSRGLLTKAQYNLIVPDTLSTVSVVDHANPAGHFDVNGAEPAALSAMLNLTLEQAQQVKSKGPFASMEALGQAVSAVTGAPAEAVTGEPSLGLKSRCFRVVSEGFYAKAIDSDRYDAAATEDEKDQLLTNRTTSTVEAVLQFNDDGTYEVIYWNASPEDTHQVAGDSETVPESGGAAPEAEVPADGSGSVSS